MEQRDPNNPPPAEKRPPFASPPSEKGVFEKWFKRRAKKNPEHKPPADNQAERPAGQPNQPESQPQPERQKKKLGAKILGFLGIRRSQPERQPPQPQPETVRPTATEPSAETEPPIEKASRVRRFAKLVIGKVLGAAEREHQNVKNWDGERAKPLNTEPLLDAADDLRHAVEDLEDAMPQPAPQAPGGRAQGEYDSSPDGGNYRRFAQFDPALAAQVSQRIENRIRDLEEKVSEQSKEAKRTAAFAAAGIGVLAVAGVLLAGHEYLSHKKIKKEQKAMRKELKKQQETQAAQEEAFARLQRGQATATARRERQAYYRELSEFTHRQAKVTRETTQELRQAQAGQAVKPAEQLVPLPQAARQESLAPQLPLAERTVTHQMAELRTAVNSPEQPSPLVRTENADSVERGTFTAGPPQSLQGQPGQAVGAGGRAPNGMPPPKAPLSKAAQRELDARQAKARALAAHAWLYGVILVALLLGFVLVFALVW